MAFTTPQRPGRWRNSRGVVASGTSKGATPTKGRIVAGSQTWSSHSRSERPRQTRATPRACTRSPTLGLPIAGSAPLAPASALRASPPRGRARRPRGRTRRDGRGTGGAWSRASVPCPSRRQRMRTVSCGYPRPRRHRPQIILYPQVGGMDGQRSALSRASRRNFIIAFLDAVAYISFSEIQIAYFSP